MHNLCEEKEAMHDKNANYLIIIIITRLLVLGPRSGLERVGPENKCIWRRGRSSDEGRELEMHFVIEATSIVINNG